MIKLTDEMKDMIAAQVGIVATVREDGVPNVGPKRSSRLYDETTIIFNENTYGEICRNIKRGSKVAIAFIDREKLKGFRFVGTAEVHEEGKYYEDAVEWAVGKMGKPKAAVIIKIEEIYDLASGPNAGTRLA